jgi:DNA-directed RNA polymerase subunit RPC12/RpoP
MTTASNVKDDRSAVETKGDASLPDTTKVADNVTLQEQQRLVQPQPVLEPVRPYSWECAHCHKGVRFPSNLIQSFSCPHCHGRSFFKTRTLTMISLDV